QAGANILNNLQMFEEEAPRDGPQHPGDGSEDSPQISTVWSVIVIMELTLKEAAEKLEISVKALRYRIKANGLDPRVEDGTHGPRYVLSEDQLRILGTVPKEAVDLGDRPKPRGWSTKA